MHLMSSMSPRHQLLSEWEWHMTSGMAFFSYLVQKAICSWLEHGVSRNVLLKSEFLGDCSEQCESKGLDILFGVKESLQVVQNQYKNIHAIKCSYGLFCARLGVE